MQSTWCFVSSVLLALVPLVAQAGAVTGRQVARDADLSTAFAAAQPPAAEARWTLVPWRHSLRLALAEAERAGKAIYLFVNDGDVESGRC